MPDAAAFDYVCGHLEQHSALDRLAARGTVRLALKQAGLEAGTVEPDQMAVVIEKIMPKELENRGVAAAENLCAEMIGGLESLESSSTPETPDAVFERLGRGRP